ncbi:MAG: hypothetical protein A3F89_01510 [Deltaproteobacteria bacterium RIFCSPLOWO2_12_FULL_50_11]|nr:MAG: hypothetical protein A3F89_01510 [Deltaproteobacteria bacterium RIFCSPLOWO2_12_FULL_50_11]
MEVIMAKIAQEITLTTKNEIGTLAKVTGPIKEIGVNIKAWCAWAEGDKGQFRLVTDNNARAIEALKKAGFKTQEKEVIITTLSNKVGTLAEGAVRLAEAGVDVEYCYASAAGNEALVVLATKNNAKVIGLLR